jgi:hypothetical protein
MIVIPGNEVKPGNCYLMAAIPTVVEEPGVKIVGSRKINMNMVPCQLEWVDGETNERSPITLEEIAPPKIVTLGK